MLGLVQHCQAGPGLRHIAEAAREKAKAAHFMDTQLCIHLLQSRHVKQRRWPSHPC